MYKPNIENEMIDGFFEALSLVDTREEYYRFFEDICTVGEINAIAQRLEVAKPIPVLRKSPGRVPRPSVA